MYSITKKECFNNYTHNFKKPWSEATKINIPYGVTRIGESVFEDCKNLHSVTIPETVTYIGKRAFYNCVNLINIHIPNSVTYIDEGAFSHCFKLTDVYLSDNLKYIIYQAFGLAKFIFQEHETRDLTAFDRFSKINFTYENFKKPIKFKKLCMHKRIC